MPLPLPNLDTRRWADLVDEGRALIPRYAPDWTDHNVHDPGITLMELLAYLVEQDIYRVNQVPDRHRAKFLALLGITPEPPRPAETVLTCTLAPAETAQTLPAGLVFHAGDNRRFRATAPLTVINAALQAVHVFDGQTLIDRTRLWREGIAFAPFGPSPQTAADPDAQPAIYFSFDAPLPPGQPVTLGLWFDAPAASRAQRDALLQEARSAGHCPPARPSWPCTPADLADAVAGAAESLVPALPPHHSLRTAWDYYDGAAWRTLDPDAGEVSDDTRALTLNGLVRVTLPGPMAPVALGEQPPAPALRCRITAGRPDALTVLRHAALNALPVEQAQAVTGHFPIVAGVTPPAGQEPIPGELQRVSFTLDVQGRITALAAGPDVTGPAAQIVAYQPATASDPGSLTTTLVPLENGRGAPHQRVRLPARQVADAVLTLWTLDGGFHRWESRPDLDASRPADRHFVLDAATGEITFGNGVQGRVVPDGVPILARFDRTDAAAGNISAGASWQLDEQSAALNQSLLGEDPAAAAGRLAAITNPEAAFGGADRETLNHTAGRAAEILWSHERLAELADAHGVATLDQLDPLVVRQRRAPDRAVTLLDFERLALAVPGTQIARARAWAGIDPTYPCLKAPGTVTVVIVPELPTGQPAPTAGLLRAVEQYLDRRRVLGTRLVVTGPHYVPINIQARVQTFSSARTMRVQQDVTLALVAFLDPLHGGPQGRGWPFGRDVYRSEILQVIDDVPGVDHVLALTIAADPGDGACGNLCIGPTSLAIAGTLSIEVTG